MTAPTMQRIASGRTCRGAGFDRLTMRTPLPQPLILSLSKDEGQP